MSSTEHKMESDKSQENQSKIKELLTTFAGYSTLHGLHFVVDAGLFVRKVIWFLLLCTMTTIFIYLAYWGWTKWRKNEVYLTMEIKANDVGSLPFPAVSICNKNMMKKSKILGTDSQRYLDAFDGLLANLSFDIEEAVRQNGHQLHDTVKDCYMQDYNSPCQFDHFFDFKAGLCHTLNGNGSFMLTRKGASFGIRLLLDAEPEEYYGRFGRGGVGLSIMIHDQNSMPSSELDGYDVPTGFATSFILTRKEIIRQPDPFPSNCGEIKIQSNKPYSENSCFMETVTNKTIDECGCRILGMPAIDGKPKRFCSMPKPFKCALNVSGSFHFDPKKCPPRCRTVKYDIKTSSRVFPSGDVLERAPQHIKNMYNSSNEMTRSFHDWYRSRFALVDIFFYSSDTEVVREVPAYDFIDFAAGFGGNMGLFLGCSVLTVFEFIDIFVVVIIEWYKKKRSRVQTMSVQPS